MNALTKLLAEKGIGREATEDPRATRERERNETLAERAETRKQWASYISGFAGIEVLDGQTLKGLRESLGFDEGDLATTLGINAAMVRSAESGRDVGAFGEPLRKFVEAAQSAIGAAK
jgi:DNA-binding transcriptional regulator YiaG